MATSAKAVKCCSDQGDSMGPIKRQANPKIARVRSLFLFNMGSLRDFRKISESKNHVSLADSIHWQHPMPAIRIDRNLIAPLKCTKCVASVDRTVVFRNNPKMFFHLLLPLFAPFLIPSGTAALPLSPEWARYLRRYLWDQSFNTAHDKNGVENDMNG